LTGVLESMVLMRVLCLSLCLLQAVAVADILIFDESKHLGTPGVPEWREFAEKTPLGMNLKHVFHAQAFIGAGTLLIWQDDVKSGGWQVRLNGQGLGRLHSYESKVVHRLEVPPGTIKDGSNTLEILGPKMIDDIVLHRAVLLPGMAADVFGQASLEISVKEDDQSVPCRITVTDADGFLAPLYVAADRNLAIRPGVVYTLNGKVSAGLLPGRYKIYATRGFEYSMALHEVEVKAGSKGKVTLRIKREVPMPGYVSCDTHIHVRSFSGHGDSTAEERIPTIAGEHIELAVATDHNVHADYGPFQQKAGADEFFTMVIGNEVTTKVGHFNAFPINKGSPVVDHRSDNWSTLMSRMRKTPGVQVIQLNHPRNVHSGFSPTAPEHFNSATGQNLRGPEWDFDAVEVITSAALQDDMMRTFRDWFGLLNYGHRITGVASSDTHDVARYIIGQGRTYVPCNDSDPSRVPVDQVCKSLREGRALFGMGLLANLKVGGKFGVGDLATRQGDKVTVEVEVLGPSWVEADTVALYQNGYKVRQTRLSGTLGKAGQKALVKWVIPKPRYDAWLVAVAKGPAVKEPCWEIPRPYQHKGIDWNPRVIGATNPVWLDADGDAKFTSVRYYAQSLVREVGPSSKKLFERLAPQDSAVATQVAGILHNMQPVFKPQVLDALLKKAPLHVQQGFKDFRNALAEGP
jgi:hypothetical protein